MSQLSQRSHWNPRRGLSEVPGVLVVQGGSLQASRSLKEESQGGPNFPRGPIGIPGGVSARSQDFQRSKQGFQESQGLRGPRGAASQPGWDRVATHGLMAQHLSLQGAITAASLGHKLLGTTRGCTRAGCGPWGIVTVQQGERCAQPQPTPIATAQRGHASALRQLRALQTDSRHLKTQHKLY